jgi:hypothetical protein
VQTLEVAAATLADGGWEMFRKEISRRAGRALVVFIDGAQQGAVERGPLVNALQSVAQDSKQSGRPFFAVLIDPRHELALPALYKERE